VGAVNGLPGGRVAYDPVARHRPEPAMHRELFTVGDYLFDSTLNGVLDSADLAVDLIMAEITGVSRAHTSQEFHGNLPNAVKVPLMPSGACSSTP